jgi:hypothetical protein
MPWFGLAQCSSAFQAQFEDNLINLNTEFKENISSYIQVNTTLKALTTMNLCSQILILCKPDFFSNTPKLSTDKKTMIKSLTP